jgi:23S rRNA (uracil1939-C5)-methyltransferase
MLTPGDTLLLTIEKPAVGGRMIARHDGQVVLVAGAIPGERVRARVERATRSVAYAETTAIDNPSADRRTWEGDAWCGGCLYAHMAYPRQLEIKAAVVADAFARIGRLRLPASIDVVPSPESGYRMRARLHVRAMRLGFFREGSHELCHARQTRQLLADTCDVLDRIEALVRSLGLDAIREIDLAENADASARIVAVESVAPLAEQAVAQLASIDGVTGVVSGALAIGDPHVTDTVDIGDAATVTLRRHVLAFFQGNRFLLPRLATYVVDLVPRDGHVIDLYAGGGLFSVAAAAARQAHVTAVEGDRTAAADLVANTIAVPEITPIREPVEHYLNRWSSEPRAGGRRDRLVAIVDPPRTGMSKEAMGGLVRLGAARIVYVSCDVATLARDARALVDAGYALVSLQGFDLFPNTPHVETVAAFDRAAA